MKWRRLLLVIIPFPLILLTSFATYRSPNLSRLTPIHSNTAASQDNIGIPKRLVIPKINVDASVQNVGINTNGEMEVPGSAIDVGWYELGYRPGEKGNAVIAGHANGENGGVGIFADLGKLMKDDEVYVEDATGVYRTFKVLGTNELDPGYADEAFSQSKEIYLNLITCSGDWDSQNNIYTKRLVVYTQLK